MSIKYYKFIIIVLFACFVSNTSISQSVEEIEIEGNKRISDETIILFSGFENNNQINERNINNMLKNLYDTNYFKDVSIKLENNILFISVIEEPLIQNIFINGIKRNEIIKLIKSNTSLKNRSAFNDFLLKEDLVKINDLLKSQGYYFSKVTTFKEELDDNKINLVYEINLGQKAKIKNIKFTGEKVFKNRKLRSVILSEEYKFWKFISGKKYLNEQLIQFDEDLLKNFYRNEGYYNVKINSSFARLINDNEFELIYNINSGDKYYFDQLELKMSLDYDETNFNKIEKLFKKLKGKPYSVNAINQILNRIDEIIIQEQFESIKAVVTEKVVNDKINMIFLINKTDNVYVERINIFGNNVTEEKVIRNQFEVDEGDVFNEILFTKSLNNLKSLNFFKDVNSEVLTNDDDRNKVINISVEEKATGEIMAGAGVGTSGSTVVFGVKENNYLGKGVALNTLVEVSEEDIKGSFSVNNPNFRNSNKSIRFSVESIETDKLTTSGYKNNKTGFSIGTAFEFFDDLNLFLGSSNYYEKIETNSTASVKQRKQEGNYWDSVINLSFTQDKRNSRFQTTNGYLSRYNLDLPVLSDTGTLRNIYNYKFYAQPYENNVTSIGFSVGSAFSLNGEDIKLSERLFIPSKNLRGFERNKVGPKDGKDFIGGNLMTSLNFTSSIPQLLPNSQNIDAIFFFDAANLWGVDYDSSLDDDGDLRSSFGIALDMFTVIGPMSFSLAQPISKGSADITESFRFNIGTSF